MLSMNSAAPVKEANVKSVCNSLKKKLQEKYPELGINNELKTINNGFQITCKDWIFDIVRYGKFVRLDIRKTSERQAKFFKTDATEVRDVVAIFTSKIDDELRKAANEQPAPAEEPKVVTPLRWVSETGVYGNSGFYAYLTKPDGTEERLAHVATCGMIYYEDTNIAQLDRIKINEKASRIYHEWQTAYNNATDEEKETTFIAPNLTVADSLAMSRDLKKVEMREKNPTKYKNYPTREEWLNEWKEEMFNLLKEDGYKYPSDISTNSSRKGKKLMKMLRLASSKVDREPGEPNPFYPDTELNMPLTVQEVLDSLGEALSRDPDTGALIVHLSEGETEKSPYFARITTKSYADNQLVAEGDASAVVSVQVVYGDYTQSPEIDMELSDVPATLEETIKTAISSSRQLNSSTLPVGKPSYDDTASEFESDMNSILSLSTGDTLDVKQAYLAYNPETHELILSDESKENLDAGYVIVGEFTPDVDVLAKIAGEDGTDDIPEEEEEELSEEEEGMKEDEFPREEEAENNEEENAPVDSHIAE